ncbi:MAG: hypothetical protein KDB25_00645 [Leucobacter sp.]|nr:hypothetical protein [Leucobacter sp.]
MSVRESAGRMRAGRARRGGSPRPNRRPGRWAGWIGGGLAAALLVGLAVVASGFDTHETPRDDPSVWAWRADAGQYARVNTETAEIDTVRAVHGPSGIVQAGDFSMVLTEGDSSAWAIDPAAPVDLVERADAQPPRGAAAGSAAGAAAAEASGEPSHERDGEGAIRTPAGTRQVIAAGEWVLFRTGTDAYVARAEPASDEGGTAAALGPIRAIDPFAGAAGAPRQALDGGGTAPRDYVVDAAALDATGLVALYSRAEHAVRWYDAARGEFVGEAERVPGEAPGDPARSAAAGPQLTIAGGAWALFDAESGRLWRSGAATPVRLATVGTALLQGASAARDADATVLVADTGGLWAVGAWGGEPMRIAEASGVPARPEQVGDEMVAAWVAAGGATMWTTATGERPLDLDLTGTERLTRPQPVIQRAGSRALVVETASGMMWTVPNGRLIPTSQWGLVDPPESAVGEVEVEATEQLPPQARDDRFGVRASEPATLPVLLNDSDPNRTDALTIDPERFGQGLPEGFGSVALLADGQGVVFRPAEGVAAGEMATFTYRVSDGREVSEPATVTLRIAGAEESTAPAWCDTAVEECQRAWPAPSLTPGGTLVLPMLEGWVDPEGDPVALASATVEGADAARALVTADGSLVVRHLDPNAGAGRIDVRLTVVDTRGLATTRLLAIALDPLAPAEFPPMAVSAVVGEETVLRPLARAVGGSGSFELVDAAVRGGGTAEAEVNRIAGTVEVRADGAGESTLDVILRDTVTGARIRGVIRVTATPRNPGLVIPPLRAFVRPESDTTIDLLGAIPGGEGRALSVRSVDAVPVSGAYELRADVVEHARIRISGGTADAQPGYVGALEVLVDESLPDGSPGATLVGRVAVFGVSPVHAGAIAVPDAAAVRAGSVVDIPVLDNDIAPPGERLVLAAKVIAPGAPGELAFASGSRVRYLAPREPGDYVLTYTVAAASDPERADTGTVRVRVLPAASKHDPRPVDVTLRVAPGGLASTAIPVSGVDPDGDRVRLVSVGQPESGGFAASIEPRGRTILVEAAAGAAPGVETIDYTVRDESGAEGTGRLRVIVTVPDERGGAPIVYTDEVRLAPGATGPAVIRPLDNDLDPSGGRLELVDVVPSTAAGVGSAEHRELMRRLDTGDLAQGIVRIAGATKPRSDTYRYRVRSTRTTSTADGLIVVRTGDAAAAQAPLVRDTVLTVRDRAELSGAGIDVVTGRVQWAAGDASKLVLSLWGDAAERYRVDGLRIIGAYRNEGDLVPFRLAGPDMNGDLVESFGFLFVPSLDELQLSLRADVSPIVVDETGEVTRDVVSMLDLGPGDRVELRPGAAFPVQRGQASCSPLGATGLRYTAGEGAPFRDSCMISVRLVGQRSYTVLPVPIRIVPREPVIELHPLTRSIDPGASVRIDLTEMAEWQGGRVGDLGSLSWRITSAAPFEAALSGSTLSVTAPSALAATPGAQAAVTVSVSGAGESRSLLTLRVGLAPKELPVAGTVAASCAARSAPCEIGLIGGAGGQLDPFAGRAGGSGLTVDGFFAGDCPIAAARVSGDGVRIEWTDPDGPGLACRAEFTVRDAGGRVSAPGTVAIELGGVPRPPVLSLAEYTGSGLAFDVVLGAPAARPEVTGLVLVQDGARVPGACEGLARCAVTGIPNGERHEFQVIAVNAVGESQPSSALAAWPFEKPAAPSISVVQRSAVSAARGAVDVTVAGGDDVREYRIVSDDGAEARVSGASGVATLTVGAGERRITAVPISRFAPPGSIGDVEGAAAEAVLSVAGLPRVFVEASSDGPDGTVSVSVRLEPNGGGSPLFGYALDGAACTPTEGGLAGSFDFVAAMYTTVRVTACGSTEWGAAETASAEVVAGGRPPRVEGLTFAVGPSATGLGDTRRFTPTAPSPSGLVAGGSVQYRVDGGAARDAFPELSDSARSNVEARQCVGTACSAWSPVGWEHAPAPLTVVFSRPPAGCAPAGTDWGQLIGISQPGAPVAFSQNATGVTVTFAGDYAGLDPVVFAIAACSDP